MVRTIAACERKQEAEDAVAGIKRKYEAQRDHCSSMIHFIELTQRRVHALFDPSCAEMRAKLQTSVKSHPTAVVRQCMVDTVRAR